MKNRNYRIYADGDIVNEDDFNERDNAQPFHDDYAVVSVPEILIEHIENEALGK